MQLSPNSITFIALCHEYCSAIQDASQTEEEDFIKKMTGLLPRLYIAATDLPDDEQSDGYVDYIMTEYDYNDIVDRLRSLFGEDDTYLEVFEADMKYSDTPIGASLAEGLADLCQVCFNIVQTVKEAPTEIIPDILATAKYDFTIYWSQKIVNVMRPLNQIRYRQ